MFRIFIIIAAIFSCQGYMMGNVVIDQEQEKQLKEQVPVGAVFEHYSGKRYRILNLARHSETLELCVVYQGLYDCPTFGPHPIWVRPLAMFVEKVVIDGQERPRFQWIE